MPRPNFLIIMSDEHDPRVSEPYGHPFVATPALQRLAERGTVFHAAYCNSPLCVPSRASFMTGKHLHRLGVWDNGVPLASDEPTWAHRLSAVGYETALAGKMHFVGPDQRHGFARRLVEDIHGEGSFHPANWDIEIGTPSPTRFHRIEEAGPGDTLHQQYDDEVVGQTCAYLAESSRQQLPWALCVSLITPHFPLTVRQPYFDRYFPAHADLPTLPPDHLNRLHPQSVRLRRWFQSDRFTDEQIARARAAYYGLVTSCDARVGDILDALDAHGLRENTVVVYTADHGELHGEHGLWWKCSFYEASARVPLIVAWPGHIAPGTRHGTVTSLIDVVRTMIDLAEADASELDGQSLSALLMGMQEDHDGIALAEYEAHGTRTPGRMVRRGRYKLNYYGDEPPELYDLAADPDEFDDLAGRPQYAMIQNQLTALVREGWDPEEIDERVRESQQRRRIIAASLPAATEYGWIRPESP